MKLNDLNPLLGSYRSSDQSWELGLDCPKCGRRFSIRVSSWPHPIHPMWQIIGMDHSREGWDAISIFPSINNHPRGRNWPQCDAHFTITDGQVLTN